MILTETVEVPLWFLLFFSAVQWFLLWLDGKRADLWRKYIEAVNAHIAAERIMK